MSSKHAASESASSWVSEMQEYEDLAKQVCPLVRLVTKDHSFWSITGFLLQLFSFGQFKRTRFLNQFASTLGPLQAYPKSWKILSRRLLVHEARHTQQFLLAGWFVPILGWLGARYRVWVGILPMAFVYGSFPIPMFFCWGRFWLELDAESHSWRIGLANGFLTPEQVMKRAEEHSALVSSWAYLKAWPKSWSRKAFQKRANQEIARWQAETAAGKSNRIESLIED